MRHRLKGIVNTLVFTKHVVMGLQLELEMGREESIPPGAKIADREPLVARRSEAAEEEMRVVWHQAIGRADQSMPSEGVAKQFAQPCVMKRVEPTGLSAIDGHGPVDKRAATVVLWRQALQTLLM